MILGDGTQLETGRYRTRFAFSFPLGNENKGVDPVEPGSSNSPPDCCIGWVRVLYLMPYQIKKTIQKDGLSIWWTI